jgi:hypothetical protein
MVRCWNCIYCKAFVDREYQHPLYVCLFNDKVYLAYNVSDEVECPHYKYRDTPIMRKKENDSVLVFFKLSNPPPFAKSVRVDY